MRCGRCRSRPLSNRAGGDHPGGSVHPYSASVAEIGSNAVRIVGHRAIRRSSSWIQRSRLWKSVIGEGAQRVLRARLFPWRVRSGVGRRQPSSDRLPPKGTDLSCPVVTLVRRSVHVPAGLQACRRAAPRSCRSCSFRWPRSQRCRWRLRGSRSLDRRRVRQPTVRRLQRRRGRVRCRLLLR